MHENDFLMHYGVRGQKWGVRRYQNEDGTLTAEGRERYGYSGDKSGKFSKIKQILNSGRESVSSRIRRTVDAKKESYANKHKTASSMTDQELRERTNRLQMEANYKRLQNEVYGNHKQKKSFGEKHPIIKQLAITTSLGVASNLITKQLNTKADEILAPRRMKRAKEKGMLNKDLFPFVYSTSGRISAYNNSEKAKAAAEVDIAARAKDLYEKNVGKAVSEAMKQSENAKYSDGASLIRAALRKKNKS